MLADGDDVLLLLLLLQQPFSVFSLPERRLSHNFLTLVSAHLSRRLLRLEGHPHGQGTADHVDQAHDGLQQHGLDQ